MAQIYVFGRVMHELTPKESQSKQPYVCFDLVERSGGEHPNFYQVWARGDQVAVRQEHRHARWVEYAHGWVEGVLARVERVAHAVVLEEEAQALE